MKKFPDIIPVFPLSGVIYFPNTNLPLNIFEERYLKLVDDTYRRDKLMGMVQSQKMENKVYNIGCLGRISDYQKSQDGRILINLTGLTRFRIIEEIKNEKLYREFKVDYSRFKIDQENISSDIKIEGLIEKAKIFFKRNGLLLNWKEFDRLDKVQRVNTLSMISPITIEEKQKLLETVSIEDKIKNLENIIGFYLHEVNFDNQTVQ